MHQRLYIDLTGRISPAVFHRKIKLLNDGILLHQNDIESITLNSFKNSLQNSEKLRWASSQTIAGPSGTLALTYLRYRGFYIATSVQVWPHVIS